MAIDRLVSLDLGVVPEAAVSGGLLLQTESSVYFLFNAMRVEPDGRRVEAGTAALRFEASLQSRFGYPDDSARRGHPVLARPDVGYGIYEVMNSSWLADVQRQYKVGFAGMRHFVVTLHDSTFECLARAVSLDVRSDGYEAAFQRIAAKAMQDPR